MIPLSTPDRMYWLSKTWYFGAYQVPMHRPSHKCREISAAATS